MAQDSSPPVALANAPSSINVTAYAEIAAQLRFAPRGHAAEILERNGLVESQWREVADGFRRAIAGEIARGEHELLLAYAKAFRVPDQAESRATSDKALLGTSDGVSASSPPVHLATFQLAALAALPPTPEHASAPPAEPTDELTLIADADSRAPGQAVLPFRPVTLSSDSLRSASSSTTPLRIPAGTLALAIPIDLPPPLPFKDHGPAAQEHEVFHPHRGESAQSSSAAVPSLSLGQYVSLCVDLAAESADPDEVLGRYGIEAGHLAVDLHALWSTRFAADPGLAQRYAILRAQHESRKSTL